MEISHSPPVIPRPPHKSATARRDNTERAPTQLDEAPPEEDLSPAAMLQRFVDSTDEMSAAMVQFRNRRDLKKTEAVADGFERVLEEDVLPKVQQVLKAALIFASTFELLQQVRS